MRKEAPSEVVGKRSIEVIVGELKDLVGSLEKGSVTELAFSDSLYYWLASEDVEIYINEVIKAREDLDTESQVKSESDLRIQEHRLAHLEERIDVRCQDSKNFPGYEEAHERMERLFGEILNTTSANRVKSITVLRNVLSDYVKWNQSQVRK